MAGLLLALGGCSTKPLNTQVPSRFDLDGDWLLLADLSEAPPLQPARRAPMTPAELARRRPLGGGMAFVSHDFPGIKARRLHIEQVGDSMGIEYDGGIYRDISWGERDRGLWRVSAGWNDEGQLVIRSRASDARALETLSLTEGGDRLEMRIEIKTDDDNLNILRVYERI